MTGRRTDAELFLTFGYVPGLSEASLDWLDCDRDYDIGRGVEQESWWVSRGVKTLRSTITSELASTDSNALHVVPLSAGRDSSTILMGLLDHLQSSQLVLATFGVPGTWDFEIPQLMAKKFGLRHERFNLLDEKWDLSQLVRTAELLVHPANVHQSHVHRTMVEHFGRDCVFWSGFMGDIAYKEYAAPPPTDRVSALKLYFDLHEPCKYRGGEYWQRMFTYVLNETPWDRLQHSRFDLERQYMNSVGQVFKIRPVVIVPGFKYVTPFTSREWVDYATSAPYQLHYHGHLMRRIVCDAYEQLADVPSLHTYGMPLKSSRQRVFVGKVLAKMNARLNRRNVYHVHPRTNYIPWGEALRRKGPLQETVYATLIALGERGLIGKRDIAGWWTDHLEQRANNQLLLMNLSSLELHLQAGKIATC
jgi:hypothetical protein